MSVLGYPYYSLGVQGKLGNKASTKSIASINLPNLTTDEARNAAATDLNAIAKLFLRPTQYVFAETSLTTKEEVI